MFSSLNKKYYFTAFGLSLIATIVIAVSPAEARIASNTSQNIPPHFQTYAAFKTWVNHSSFGGGHAETFSFKGGRFSAAYRSYTSGVITSDISVFAHNMDGSLNFKAHHPMIAGRIYLQKTPEKIYFISDDTGETVLDLTFADLVGTSCHARRDCAKNEYCLKNETFTVKGLCMPCPQDRKSFLRLCR